MFASVLAPPSVALAVVSTVAFVESTVVFVESVVVAGVLVLPQAANNNAVEKAIMIFFMVFLF
jgi:hypothetical protein